VREVLSRLRHPARARRERPGRVRAVLGDERGDLTVATLSFRDRSGTPTEFYRDAREESEFTEFTGTAFVVGRTAPFRGPLWSRLAEDLGVPNVEPARIDLRARGAAVVETHCGDEDCEIRIVPCASAQDVVRRNHHNLAAVRGWLAGRDRLLALLPRPLVLDDRCDPLVLVETHLPGTLAWRPARGSLGPRIYGEALDFLEDFRQATLRGEPLYPEEARETLAREHERLAEADFVSDDLRIGIARELEHAEEALAEAELLPYASHGDFGYGNILVDAHTGRITGIIDWDTARAVDFPGIDRVNLEIQIERSVGGRTFSEAVASLWDSDDLRGALQGARSDVETRALFGLAVCRYVMRSFSYPRLYLREADEFERALARLDGLETPGR